jgi:ribosomal protein L11 methylase PrmA
VWDLGGNTGRFSRIAAEHADHVVTVDADPLAIERLYRELRKDGPANILPIIGNVADPSPGLGWRGLERLPLARRGTPDLILALALIHHVVITANVPLAEFVDWLAGLGGELVIEFVTKQDEMVKTLLRNKDDQYTDYDQAYFESCLEQHYRIAARETIQSGSRTLYHAIPRP